MTSIGIDLGTTYSAAAMYGRVMNLSRTGKQTTLLPSVVAFLPNGKVLVGQEARERRIIDPKNTIRSAKRLMGETFFSYQTKRYKEHYGFDLVMTKEGEVAYNTRAGWITPEEVATLVIANLCTQAQIIPDRCTVVVTVPASFRIPQRQATRRALQEVGFGQVYLIDEPVATAIAYLERSNLKYSAVYDFGGGTFEMAILDCTGELFKVIGYECDSYLGGDDIDYTIASWAVDEVLQRYGWDLKSDPETFGRLINQSELAKISLAELESTTLDMKNIDIAAPSALRRLIVDRKLVWELCQTLIQRTFLLCDKALDSASLKTSDIQAVFLAGGSTQLPGLAAYVSRYFSNRPRIDVDPMQVVSIGASLAAARSSILSYLSYED